MKRQDIGRLVRRHRLTGRLLGEFRVEQLRRAGGTRDFRKFMAAAQPGTVVFDIGASVGNYALAAARSVGHDGMVIALEPNATVFAELAASVWGTSVRALNLAASDQNGLAELTVPISAAGGEEWQLGSLAERSHNPADKSVRREIRTVKIDDLAPAGRRVSAIKVDVEGHELAALKGAVDILRRDQPVLIVEIERRHLVGMTMDDVVAWIVAQGYDAFAIGADEEIPWGEFDVDENQTKWLDTVNGVSVIRSGAHYVNNFVFVPRRFEPV